MSNFPDQAPTDDNWHAIMHASETLLEAARQADWDGLSEQACVRDRLIRDYFSQPITVDNALKIHDKITRLLALDEQVLGFARKEQEKMVPALRKVALSRQAMAAYGAHKNQ